MRFEKEINIYSDEAIIKRFKANETSISVVQGKISALISESELVELQNSQTTMYSKLASAVMDIKSLTLNFSDLTTKYNTVSGQYNALDGKVAEYKLGLDGLSANVTEIKKDLQVNYSTTTEMNSAIKAKTDLISAEVNSVITTLRNDYSTTSQMNSAIQAKANEIGLSVSASYAKKADLAATTNRVSDLETWKSSAQLKITDSAIVSTVMNSSSYKASVNSMIEQKADAIRMQASKISWESTYSSMTSSGTLTCQNATIKGTLYSENGKDKVYLRNGRMRIYYNNQELGLIGGNGFAGYTNIEGLNFDLEYTGDYMAWASQDTSSQSNYYIKLIYTRKAFEGYKADAINLGCDIALKGHKLYLNRNEDTCIYPYSAGAAVRTLKYFLIENGSGNNIAWFDDENIMLTRPVYANIAGTPSDERIKMNIRPADTCALDVFEKMNFKSFDWIENGEHEAIGLIAQELEKLVPELVNENKELKHINTTRLLWYCAKAIQELYQIITPERNFVYMENQQMTLEEKKKWIFERKEKLKPVKELPKKVCIHK